MHHIVAASEKSLAALLFAVLDNNGNVVVEYKYDAWGNHEAEVANEDYVTLAEINPFRYRGYYYDEETGLYYLQTRYYDPTIGRFISPDSVDYLDPESINGLNLYIYCLNNPVMYSDPDGNLALLTVFITLIIGAITGGTLSAITASNAGLDTLGIILSAIGGAIMGAAVAGSFALGGAAVTGLTIGIKTLNVSGVSLFAISAFGTAVASTANYFLQSKAYDNPTSLEGYFISAFSGFIEGTLSFGLGAIAGVKGFFRNADKSIFKKSKIVEIISRAVIFNLPSAIFRKAFRDNLQNNWGIYW